MKYTLYLVQPLALLVLSQILKSHALFVDTYSQVQVYICLPSFYSTESTTTLSGEYSLDAMRGEVECGQ